MIVLINQFNRTYKIKDELNNWNSISQAVTITNASDTVSTNSSPDESTSSSEITSDESQLTGSNNNIVVGTAAGAMEMSDPMKFPKRPHQHHHQQHYSSKLTNQQSNKLKGTQSAQNTAPLIYDPTDPTSGGATKDASNSIFDLENNATLDEGQSALLSIEATTISTSQMNIALHSRGGGQAAALIDDDDEDPSSLY